METIIYHTRDKSSWAEGPWKDEPDKMQWQDPATQLPCLIVRGPSGALCGYVGVTEGHPAFYKSYDYLEISVHGGLTFSDHCQSGDESHAICHIPGKGESDDVWWLGFDCAHAGDIMPGTDALLDIKEAPFWNHHALYRDLSYVRAQVTSLAKQLSELSHAP